MVSVIMDLVTARQRVVMVMGTAVTVATTQILP